MKKIITTAFAAMAAFYCYSQDGVHLPLSAGSANPLSGILYNSANNEFSVSKPATANVAQYQSWYNSAGIRRGWFGYGSIGDNTLSLTNETGGALNFNNGTVRYTIDASGNNTWTGSGTFAGALYMGSTTNQPIYFDGGYSAYIKGGGIGHGTSLDIWTGNGLPNPTLRALNGNVQLFGQLTGTSATFNGLTLNETTGVPGSNIGSIRFKQLNSSGFDVAYIKGLQGANIYEGILSFETKDASGTLAERMRINSNGNVGIGTSTPGSFKLFVNGSTSSQLDADGDNMADFVNTHNGTYTYGAGGVIIRTTNVVSSANNATGSGALVIRNGASNYTANINYNGSAYFGGPFLVGSTTDDGINKLQVTGGGKFSGNVNIGTTQANSNLYVHGTIKSKEVKVEATVTVPDYVFEKSYDLQSLPEVEKYITENKHLQEIPSAKEIQKDGIDVGNMQLSLLKKIEELTLHLIEQNKLNVQQNKRIEELEKQLKK